MSRATLLALAALATTAAAVVDITAGALSIALEPTTGALSVSIGGTPWFDGGDAAMRDDRTWFISTTNKDDDGVFKPLVLANASTGPAGTDEIGAYGATTTLEWHTTAGTNKDGVKRMIVTFRPYPLVGVVVRQSFPDGLVPGNTQGELEEIVSSGFSIAKIREHLRVLIFQGVQLQNTEIIDWPAGAAFSVPSADGSTYTGSPFVAHDGKMGTLVLGPLDNHFTTVRRPVTDGLSGGQFACGFHGQVAEVPRGWAHEVLLVGGTGVRSALRTYGTALLAASKGGKTHALAEQMQATDLGISRLGYYTDNGAFYYYNTEKIASSNDDRSSPSSISSSSGAPCHTATGNQGPNAGCKNYQDSLSDVREYLKKINLPYKYIQLDSWWYTKNDDQGCHLWEPRADVFPGGLDPSSVGDVPLVLHNRFFTTESAYVQNYTFVTGTPGKHGEATAVPMDPAFFPHIMGRAKKWGMITYEQDFLTRTFASIPALASNISLAKTWLAYMNDAAKDLNVSIQYCMTQPQHLLQTASFPQVLSGRASKDYNADRDQWSYFPLNAMLYGAIALAPFKDNFWSTTNNPGNNWHVNESNPELMALVSSLSAGPVGPSDKIGLLNTTVVMQCSRADGVLLRPDEPMAPLDAAFAAAFTAPLNPSKQVESPGVWPVHTFSAGMGHHYVVNALRSTPLTLVPGDLTGADAKAELWSYEYYSSGAAKGVETFAVTPVSAAAPLVLRATMTKDTTHGAPVDFELHVLFSPAPDTKTQYTIVGEATKFVSGAKERWRSVTYGGTISTAVLTGMVGEKVVVMAVAPETNMVTHITCVIPQSGTSTIVCNSALAMGLCKCDGHY